MASSHTRARFGKVQERFTEMDALIPVALIAFVAQFLMWLGLPERPGTAEMFPVVAEPEAMAA
jgi:hypothetical protein